MSVKKSARERIDTMKLAFGGYDIRDYKDLAIAELIAILDLIVPAEPTEPSRAATNKKDQ